MVREMDLVPNDRVDNRRLEVAPYGLPLFGGAQLAMNTTLVSALRRDGTSRPQADSIDGVALAAARRNKARTDPELSGGDGRARLVALAAEVGGRWSEEARKFLVALATAKALCSSLLQPSVRAASAECACCLAPSLERFVGMHSSAQFCRVPSGQHCSWGGWSCSIQAGCAVLFSPLVVSCGVDLSSVSSRLKKRDPETVP